MIAERIVPAIEPYKGRIVLMAYHHETVDNDIIPLLDNIVYQVKRHFRQEFALEVQRKDRYATYGAEDEATFLMLLESGKLDRYRPNVNDIVDVLDVLNLVHLDWEETTTVYNSPLQEVW